MNLFVNYYRDSDPRRQEEIDHCLSMNAMCPHIRAVVVLKEKDVPLNLKNVYTITVEGRPTFDTFFEVVNAFSSESDVNIISNADIYMDNTITLVKNIEEGKVLCLSKWEADSGKHMEITGDSADTWIFRGHMNIKAPFQMGKCGVDNRLAWEFANAGYEASNPSKTIKTWHVHSSGVRHYSRDNRNDYVDPPYLTVPVE